MEFTTTSLFRFCYMPALRRLRFRFANAARVNSSRIGMTRISGTCVLLGFAAGGLGGVSAPTTQFNGLARFTAPKPFVPSNNVPGRETFLCAAKPPSSARLAQRRWFTEAEDRIDILERAPFARDRELLASGARGVSRACRLDRLRMASFLCNVALKGISRSQRTARGCRGERVGSVVAYCPPPRSAGLECLSVFPGPHGGTTPVAEWSAHNPFKKSLNHHATFARTPGAGIS